MAGQDKTVGTMEKTTNANTSIYNFSMSTISNSIRSVGLIKRRLNE